MQTEEQLQEQLEKLAEIRDSFPIFEQKYRIIEDVLDNYSESYTRKMMSTMKASAGTLVPLEQAQFCIKVYKEILEEE